MMAYAHYKQAMAALVEASAALNAVEGGPVPVKVGSAPRRSNPPLDGANLKT